MRIFKNKIIFFGIYVLNGIQMGYSRPTDFTDEHSFFDLFGQIYANYLRTYAVPLVGDRNLKGWLRVLTQQSCWLRKILIILTHHSSPLIYRRIFYLDKAEIMPNNGNLLG